MVEPNFEELLDMSQLSEEDLAPRRYRPGETVQGEVIRVDDEGLVVSVGMKNEGMVPSSEMRTLTQEERERLRPGDLLWLVLTQGERGGQMAQLSLDQARHQRLWVDLQEALDGNATVTARVTGHNRGGLEVDVQGLRGFVPVSHVAPTSADGREKDLAARVGDQSQFHVLEVDPNQERLVLSERAIWQERRDEARRQFIDGLEEGTLVTGRVTSLRGFGAFVNLGGADGLIPISELSWSMIKSPDEVVKVGDELQVQVLKVDRENQKVSLSWKRTKPEPWETVPERYNEGDIVEGTVTRLADFGAFVKLEDWVEGLIHISELSQRRLNHPKEMVYQGQKVKVMVLGIDAPKRRISLSFKRAYGG
jgi:small subunit ribosomal protein S1